MIGTDGELIAVLARRTGCGGDELFGPLTAARIRRGWAYPLDEAATEALVRAVVEDMTRVVQTGIGADTDPGSRYVWLHELVTHYESVRTRTVVTRNEAAGRTPARTSPGHDYDPRGEEHDLDPDEYPSDPATAAWFRTWRERVEAAGVRAVWRMPAPYARAEAGVPIDAALDAFTRTGDRPAYRRALRRIRDAEFRDVDAWAHSGSEVLARADAVTATTTRAATQRRALLSQALGYYQTGVVVGELSLPPRFTDVLPYSVLDNRPFHRARHGLALTWWRMGDFDRAAAITRSALWIDPADPRGLGELLPPLRSRTAYTDHIGGTAP